MYLVFVLRPCTENDYILKEILYQTGEQPEKKRKPFYNDIKECVKKKCQTIERNVQKEEI